MDTTSQNIRKAVTELGYNSVKQRKSKRDILPLEILKVAKKRWFSPMLTMPQMKPMNYGKLISLSLKFVEFLYHRLNSDSKKIGVISNPSLFSVIANLALMFMNKTVVNLSSDRSDKEIIKACKELGIQEVLCFEDSRKLGEFPVHEFSAEDLKVNSLKIKLIGLGLFFTPSVFLVRKILSNSAGPDDVVAILLPAQHNQQPVHITHYTVLSNTEAFSQLLFMRHNDWILSESSCQTSVGYMGQLWYPLLNAVGIACTNVSEKKLTVNTINALMRQYKITLLISGNEFYRKILNSEQTLTFPSIRFAVSVGNSKDDSIYKEFQDRIQVELFEGFGVPELPLVVSLNHYSYIADGVKQIGTKKGSFGKPLPGMIAQIVNKDTKELLPVNEEGLLMVKGPNVSANIETEEGWINTHRKAFIDSDGFLHLVSEADV